MSRSRTVLPSGESLRSRLDELLGSAGHSLPTSNRDQLVALVELMVKWNRVYNLTAVRDPMAMLSRHIVDSLSLLPWLPDSSMSANSASDAVSDPGCFDIMDVGSGAGLPGLPIAIARTDLTILSVESNGKKSRFQQQAVLELGLQNVTVANHRIQDVSAQARCVTARAFTAPETFLNMADALCLSPGTAIIMLGKAERLPATLPAPFVLSTLQSLDLTDTDASRHLAICDKP